MSAQVIQLRPLRVGVGATPTEASEPPASPALTIATNTAVGAILFAGVAGLLGSERAGFWGAVGAMAGGGLALYVVSTQPASSQAVGGTSA